MGGNFGNGVPFTGSRGQKWQEKMFFFTGKMLHIFSYFALKQFDNKNYPRI
jgi:hypothetical protein